MRKIELLAPARNLETGIEAIRHGADAVYIGASKFGARAAAGNSVDDIRQLVDFAHPYGVKVYVTLNTLLNDNELEEARLLTHELVDAGVDALIVQDLKILHSPLPLHASTQMDNQTAEKVAWLRDQGFRQVVLARELTLSEISEIHHQVPEVRLEVFVHGAICVCYNGRCFASEHCFGRSANRGECAQFCRLPFDLIETKGKGLTGKDEERVLVKQKHLLSLRDMNRSDDLEALLDAGVSSLKIEGRLKDVNYVKNVTAYYRQRLNEIFRRRPEYSRSSLGYETIDFTPAPEKSFNRLFTNYFLHGRTSEMANIHTPKSMGEPIGRAEVKGEGLRVHNGDGLCYINKKGELEGFRVNRIDGDKIYLTSGATLSLRGNKEGLYRNYNHEFEQRLSKPTATRKVGVSWVLKDTSTGFRLQLTREDGKTIERDFGHTHELARSPQREQIAQQLSRLGDTPYETTDISIELSDNWFVPRSLLADWRREMVAFMEMTSGKGQEAKDKSLDISQTDIPYTDGFVPEQVPTLRGESLSDLIQRQRHPDEPGLLMICRYCIRHELGMCLKGARVKALPLYLRLSDGRRFCLQFDCKNCQMKVWATDNR